MKYATSILAIIFVFSAVFGFAVMCHELADTHHESTADCMITTITSCMSDGLPMAISHITAYQSFSNTTVASMVLSLSLISLLVIVGLVVSYTQHAALVPVYAHIEDRWRDDSSVALRIKKKLSSFLSLFENSPSF